MGLIDLDKVTDDILGEKEVKSSKLEPVQYHILIVDDDEEVHRVTKMMLKAYRFEGHPIALHHAYKQEEAQDILRSKDIALVFLDVVMEEKNTGFKLIEWIRDEMALGAIRIILRTGQPGQAPETEVIEKYDINDYLLKTELTFRRLNTSLYAALRSYRDIRSLEKHKKGLEKIISASGRLFESHSLSDFLNGILSELAAFQKGEQELVYIRGKEPNGVVLLEKNKEYEVVAATGKYEKYIGQCIDNINSLSQLKDQLNTHKKGEVIPLENGFFIESKSNSKSRNCIYVEGKKDQFDYQMIHLFLSNFSVALDNHILNEMVKETQNNILFAFAETIESHFEETGNHVRRISKMMYEFALALHSSYSEAETYKLASTMHDLGKIAVPDHILKKPGPLTDEEFEFIKLHPIKGHEILSKSNMPVLELASKIALYHHEKYDGSGYPNGLKGLEIPKAARMMAIVDVFDALTHKRVYKDAMPVEDALMIIKSGKNKHFDGDLVDVFLAKIEQILSGL